MRRAFVFLSLLACGRPHHEPLPRPAARSTDANANAAAASDTLTRVEAAGEVFAFRSWLFETPRARFTVVDLAMHGSLTEALGSEGRVAVNGGFFDPDGKPLGLASSGGTVLSKFSPTMSGGVFFTTQGLAHVAATEDFDPHISVDFAVQCRPRLVVHGRPNVARDDGQRAERTALCVRDEGRAVEVMVAQPVAGSRGPSLFALGRFLSDHGCEDALNLDGGPSTGAAYRTGGSGSAASVLPPRGPLRHALVVAPL